MQDSAAAMVSFLARHRSSRIRAASISSGAAIHVTPLIQSIQGSRTVAVANAAMPSLRPMNPSFSLVVAFTATRLTSISGDLGDAHAHGVAMGADAGRFADHIDVEMGDAAFARAQALDREGEEKIGGGAAPLRIAGRKVHPDVAIRERAQNGVDQRMQHHVGVGMPGQPLHMRDAHAAERDMIAGPERVHVVTEAGAHIGEGRKLGCPGAHEVIRRGELHIGGFALEGADLDAGPFGQRRVIGEVLAPGGARPLMGLQQDREGERLRRLHQAKWRALDRSGHDAGRIDGLDRIGDRKCRNGSPAGPRSRDPARDQGRGRKRPRRIVHEHDVRPAGAQGLKSGTHRCLPGGAAENRIAHTQPGHRGVEKIGIVGVDHRLHHADTRMAHEPLQARTDDGLAADFPILLGACAASAEPAPGSHHDGRDQPIHISRSKRYLRARARHSKRRKGAHGISL